MAKTPEYKRGPADANQLPKGAAKQLNESARAAGTGNRFPGRFAQPAPRPTSAGRQTGTPAISGDITGMDSWLFSGTDRPDEPVSAGAPWGAGPNFTKLPSEGDVEFRKRVANMLLNDPSTGAETKAMAYRMLED